MPFDPLYDVELVSVGEKFRPKQVSGAVEFPQVAATLRAVRAIGGSGSQDMVPRDPEPADSRLSLQQELLSAIQGGIKIACDYYARAAHRGVEAVIKNPHGVSGKPMFISRGPAALVRNHGSSSGIKLHNAQGEKIFGDACQADTRFVGR